jgi:uncharacterized membrane protein
MAVRHVREVVIEATPDEIWPVMLDLESLPEWSAAHQLSEVLERDEQGRPVRSRARIKTAVMTDDQEIALRYHDDGYSWSLISSAQQRSQEARYTLTPDGDRTRVRFEITIDPVLPAPGFILRRATKGVAETATDGLRRRVLQMRGRAQ